jgi:hypothetical protein
MHFDTKTSASYVPYLTLGGRHGWGEKYERMVGQLGGYTVE